MVIDGDNIAHSYKRTNKKARLQNLVLAIDWAKHNKFKPILIVSWRLIKRIDDSRGLDQLIECGKIHQIPKGIDDDIVILQVAKDKHAIILSNDQFRNYHEKFDPKFIKQMRIPFVLLIKP